MIPTWMRCQRPLLVSLLDLVVVSSPLYPEYLVIILPLGLLQSDLGLVK